MHPHDEEIQGQMSRDLGTKPLTQVRRQDRAVTDEEWIRSLLHRAAYGTLATVYGKQPFVNSNLFVYDESSHAIYFHTASKGRTRANIEKNERVCLSVSQMGRLLPADEALEFSVEYAGVVIFGQAKIVGDPTEAKHGLQLLLDKYAPHLRPGRDYRPITAGELKRTTVFRLEIEEWSGKRKQAVSDFPGAFFYGEHEGHRLFEQRREGLLISSDASKLDPAVIHDFLSNEAYWSLGITREKVARMIKHSLCFGVYSLAGGNESQIGFARVITDFSTFAYLSDVFILEPYRGRGLGKWLMECIHDHPELQDLRKWTVNTQDAHGLYMQYGYIPGPEPENYLVFRPGPPSR
jgi:nitroimidazol reductase NimA-like FMN-containing flavoprotein (pyridoxamine 5'-phosphate oxidase superfamily)/GNAT superfamily N-acetyltransferase